MRILIKNVSLLKNNQIIPEIDIFIKDDIIEQIDKNITKDYDYIIDGKDKLAMPGLVNAHTHLAMTLFRGFADDLPLKEWLETKIWPNEAKLKEEDVYWGSLLGALEMIKGGTVAFADMYFYMDKVAEVVEKSGLRANLSWGMIAILGDEEKRLENSLKFAERWHKSCNGRILVSLAPHAPYTCPPKFLEKVIDKAVQYELSIHTHLSETEGEVKEIKERYGETPIRLMDKIGLFNVPTISAHCVFVDSEEIEILAKRKVGVVHNPQSNLKLASGIAPIKDMLDKGVRVGLGTDGPASNNNLDMWEEIRLSATLHKGYKKDPTAIPAFLALEMATRRGMEILGWENSGVIEEGKKADLILVDFKRPHFFPRFNLISHLVYSANSSDVDTVIVDGKILMEKREVKTLDEERILYETEKRAFLLVKEE
ncbi:MAG: amidohydrolase family protein [Dictyoglomus sp.]|nr:amidohydrolase family protein [Dictyoglomus sp.]MDW8189240.1 amidohydrolase family protein [Dictyoglomus sp.]